MNRYTPPYTKQKNNKVSLYTTRNYIQYPVIITTMERDMKKNMYVFVVVVQSLSHVQLFRPMDCSTPGFPVLHHLLELVQTRVHRVGFAIQHLVLCPPLILLPSIFPSIRLFSKESGLLIRWPKYWGFSFNISPSNEYSGLISFRIDWFDLLADQGTLTSLLQHDSSKASILRLSLLYGLTFTSINDY